MFVSLEKPNCHLSLFFLAAFGGNILHLVVVLSLLKNTEGFLFLDEVDGQDF